MNYYSFINLEEKYQSTGGSSGASTLYLWKHIVPEVEELSADDNPDEEQRPALESTWKLVGVVTRHKGAKPSYSADLGNSFKILDDQALKSSEYEIKFFQPECSEYQEDYMLIDGNTLVKKVGEFAVKEVRK